MSDFPGRPRVTKAALLVFATSAPVPTQVVVFPLNPDTASRRFDLGQAAPARAAAGTTEHHTPATSPTEQITLTLELDATDDLERPGEHPLTVVSGLQPVLAALEQMLHPSVLMTRLVGTLAALGMSVITPAARPWIVLVWGVGRVLPVKVTALSVTEQMFDVRLHPVRARVELGLTVLTADELASAPAVLRGLPTVHAVTREALALTTTVDSLRRAPGVLPF